MATPSSILTGRLLVLAIALIAVDVLSAGDIESPRTGYFELSFTPRELLGETGALGAREILRSDGPLSWQLYVPARYDPENPPGLMVYVSPESKGGPPRRWSSALDDKNMIWIGAINAGNRVAVGKRMFLAMLAPKVAARFYAVDAERVYVSGFSGGGKTATRVAAALPDVFRGGIYIGGAEMWAGEPPPKLKLLQQNHHVFLSGSSDFNERLTRRVYAAYRAAGVEYSTLIVVRRMGHELPGIGTFTQAIDYLDSRLEEDEPATGRSDMELPRRFASDKSGE